MFDKLFRSRAVVQRHLSSPLCKSAWSICSIALADVVSSTVKKDAAVALGANCVDRTLYMGKRLRQWLEVVDTHPQAPGASWQFRALLRDGITSLLTLERLFNVAVASIDPTLVPPVAADETAAGVVGALEKPHSAEAKAMLHSAIECVNAPHTTRDSESELFAAILTIEQACFAGELDTARKACSLARELMPANHRFSQLLHAFERETANRSRSLVLDKK